MNVEWRTRALSKLDGVTATVNFATETVQVSFPAGVSAGDLISVVEQAGYTAALPPRGSGGWVPPGGGSPGVAPRRQAQPDALRRRLLVSLALAIPVVVLAMVHATRVGADTQLAQMARLVTEAQAG